jgi:4-hydroxybenzoate polyprenyltransferase
VWKKIQYTFELIKFSHTVFALPFALAAYFIATGGKLEARTFFWVLLCLVFARTAAMAFNRWVDAPWDALNPRTQDRHLPAGLLSRGYVIGLTILSSMAFIFSAAQLNFLAMVLSPFCLGVLFFYSLTKRFTSLTQIFLGLSLGIAPIGATIAVTGHVTPSSVVLGLGVLFWVAGFDLLYALQDLEFDGKHGLHSLPVRLGPRKALKLSMMFHLCFVGALFGYGCLENLGWIYRGGVGVTAALILWEHWLLKDGLGKIQAAFFTANGLLSVFFLAFVLADLLF